MVFYLENPGFNQFRSQKVGFFVISSTGLFLQTIRGEKFDMFFWTRDFQPMILLVKNRANFFHLEITV